MALIEMDFLGKVEPYAETLLWTNPSPTSNWTDSTADPTLSSPISDFDYIKVVYNYSTSNFAQYNVVTSVSEFRTQIKNNYNTPRSINFGVSLSSGLFLRAVDYVTDTSVHFSEAMRLNGSATHQNSLGIPYKIYGIKKNTRGSNNFVIQVQATATSTEYPYINGLNTYTFNKADWNIPTTSYVKNVCWLVNKNSFDQGHYFVGYASNNKAVYARSDGSSGWIKDMVYPPTSNNPIGYTETSDTVTFAFRESVSTTNLVADLIITFEK